MTRTTAFLLTAALGLVATTALAQPMWGGGRGMAGPGGLQTMFETFDRDDDGRITQAEIDQHRSERHAAFDADGDGVLSLGEFEALWLDAMRPAMTRRFQALDGNANGAVTVEEFGAPFAGVVGWLDTDEPGVVTQDDLRELREERREGRRGWHGRMMDGPHGGAMGGPGFGGFANQ